MDFQFLFNAIAGIGLAAGGWLFVTVWNSVKELEADINKLRLHVAESYVAKVEYKEDLRQIMGMLEKIRDMLGDKADK